MALDLIVIGTAITLGPLHNSAFILLLSSRRGIRQGLAFLLSWLANLITVIALVVLLTGGQPPARHSAPSTAAIAAKLAIGVALVMFGTYRHRRPPRPHGPPRWAARIDNASLVTAAGLAWLLQPWGLVGAGAATAVDSNLATLADWLVLGSVRRIMGA
ncbi:GAP family protein [Streptomyces sp. NPDC046385]|uniref:GAP family protein n=1 Tax=Streptomyces sp. NPDC046385 TaxID=3154918 RepID=UPI0033DAFB3B